MLKRLYSYVVEYLYKYILIVSTYNLTISNTVLKRIQTSNTNIVLQISTVTYGESWSPFSWASFKISFPDGQPVGWFGPGATSGRSTCVIFKNFKTFRRVLYIIYININDSGNKLNQEYFFHSKISLGASEKAAFFEDRSAGAFVKKNVGI